MGGGGRAAADPDIGACARKSGSSTYVLSRDYIVQSQVDRAAVQQERKTVMEREANPGIVICYSPDAVIHAALQHHLTPTAVLQPGVDATASAELFKSYVLRIIASTPIDEDNCVLESVGGEGRNYFPHLFHRMSQDMFFSVVKRLQRVFVTDATPVARWSLAVSAPPAPPLAKIVRVGGAGSGSVFMSVESFREGIFRH